MFILVVEDDFHTRRSLDIILRTEGHTVEIAETGEEGLSFAREYQFDAMILDLMLPDISGYQVLSRLRTAKSKLPVIVVSGMDGVGDRVKAFERGADDYLVKPFHRDELIARLRAVTRRFQGRATDVLTVGALGLDIDRRVVRVGGVPVHLSKMEFQILEIICAAEGRVVERQTIFDRLGSHGEWKSKIVEVLIHKIRHKLAAASGGVNFIETVWGQGYAAREGSAHPPNGRVPGATVDALAEARAYDAANAGRAA